MVFFSDKTKDGFAGIGELRAVQEKLLREHLEYCRDNSPYYREILGGYDFSGFTLENLKKLPFTSKHDMSSRNDDFIAVPESETVDIVFSSGTTGAPCKIAYTEHDLQRLACNEQRAFVRAGLKPDDRALLTCTLDRCFIAGLAYFLGIRKLGASAIRNGINSVVSHAAIIRDLQVTAIVGVPSFLAKLGKFMRESAYPTDSVKRLICIGEPVRDRNMQLSPVGRKLQSLWAADLCSTYASSETITTFAECECGCGGHSTCELGVLEIIDENGNTLGPGKLGEVVVTPLQIRGTPLVRFRTGDISFMETAPCPCGRNDVRLGPILGRKSQMLKVKGSTIFPQAVFSELASINHVEEYYIEVRGRHLIDEVEVFVALSTPGTSLKHIAERLYAATRVSLKVSEVDQKTAFETIFSQNSRKPTRFIDLRENGGGA
ncbi:MAG: AMP-binding protein [Victivallaceae bacterium]|nr:AMP-binding protein [Victivallaceae bacterium]